MKKIICFFTIFVFWGITDSMAQGLHFGVKAGVLGNKANISGMRDQFKEESLTGFQVGPMLQYQTGFHGIALDFSLLYVERGIKLTNTSNRRSADIKTQSIDIPIELKWEMGISNNFDLFLGVGPSFSFLVFYFQGSFTHSSLISFSDRRHHVACPTSYKKDKTESASSFVPVFSHQ